MFQYLRAAGFTNLIPEGESTNTIYTKQYDNIWVHPGQWGYESRNELTSWRVIRDDLTYYDRNKPVSDHCLVCASVPVYYNSIIKPWSPESCRTQMT